MATSFIRFKDENVGFWVNDSLLVVTCVYITQTIDKVKNPPMWLIELNELIKQNAAGIFPSCMHLNLDKFLIDDNPKKLFLTILQSAKSLFKSKGELISVEELNSYMTDDFLHSKWIKPVKTEKFIKVLDFLEALINEKLTTRSDSPIDYW